jgi:gliding motility-associated-like protein
MKTHSKMNKSLFINEIFCTLANFLQKHSLLVKLTTGLFLLPFYTQILTGQNSPGVVRLTSGGHVVNTVIYNNLGHKPLTKGFSATFSASDSVMLGTENVHLTESPFVSDFKIDTSSPIFNNGTLQGRRMSDTLDLGHNPRINCKSIDIGAFAALVLPIKITYNVEAAANETCNDGQIVPIVSGGIPYYEYLWSDNSTEKDLFYASSGIHTFSVIDAIGCEKSIDIDLFCSYKHGMVSLFFSPNGDGYNDILHIKNIEYYPSNTVAIINAYGEQIFSAKNYDNVNVFWDGRNQKGKFVPDGVYYYVVKADDEEEDVKPMAEWLVMKTSRKK